MEESKIKISSVGTGKILEYAKKEMIFFLERYSNHQIGDFSDAEREIILECRKLPVENKKSDYRIEYAESESVKTIWILSNDESGILRGVYDVLERMGLGFQMNGPVCNKLLDVTACDGVVEESDSFCRHRGIRQHINFPMDISSYHIEEAKEYIRNLARMGMNCITFHSYTGQWHGYETNSRTVYAGNYFYGQRHVIPEYEVISNNIDNDKYYCIPEIEGQLASEEARHKFSIYWLNQVMKVCKEVGMQICLSIELPDDESEDNLVHIAKGVLKSYPLIDILEWISPEGGGRGEQFFLEDLPDKVKEYFGTSPFTEKGLPYIPDSLPESLPGAMTSLKRAIDLFQRKEEILEGMEQKRIAIGLYVMCKETLKFLKHIMVSVLPKDVVLTFLPAHGSLAVAENIAFMEFTKEELQRTMIYSWIEFDGNMYLQQNSNKGIETILKQTSELTAGEPIYGMCFNHWRTAENEVVAGYFAKAAVSFEETSFYYGKYADKLGISDSPIFVEAMQLLEEIDCFNRDYLFNIGFCYLGCWLMYPGLGWIRGWDQKKMQQSIQMYEEVQKKLERCLSLTETESGIGALRLFINRIQCSILQIKCILELNLICPLADDERRVELTSDQKKWIEQQCDKAMGYARTYLELHMKLLKDRGCQGTAISYYATIPVYIDHVKQYFVYDEKEMECKHQPETFDAPPPPNTAYL